MESGRSLFGNIVAKLWGHSSVGRAPEWHSGGRRFDPVWLHSIYVLRLYFEKSADRLVLHRSYPGFAKTNSPAQLLNNNH